MNEWNEGYFTGSSYNFGYFRELNPVYMRFILNARGLAALPPSKDERHLELGYGQGVSLNIHAASNDAEYYGTDFNPAHAAGAEELRAADNSSSNFFSSKRQYSTGSSAAEFKNIVRKPQAYCRNYPQIPKTRRRCLQQL